MIKIFLLSGFTIMSWNLEPITDHSNFTVTFKSGLGLQISVFDWGINVIVSVPTKFKVRRLCSNP